MADENNTSKGSDKQDALLASLGGSVAPDGEGPSDIPEEIIKDLVRPAAILFGQSLKSTSTVKAPRVAAAKWVLEQYFKMYTPSIDRKEVHVFDHAAMIQIKQAEKVMKEYNGYLKHRINNRGGMGIGNN